MTKGSKPGTEIAKKLLNSQIMMELLRATGFDCDPFDKNDVLNCIRHLQKQGRLLSLEVEAGGRGSLGASPLEIRKETYETIGLEGI